MARDRPLVTLERLEQAASSLSAVEREVLVLSAREHLSNRAIAARLGIAPAAAERILARAIRKLAAAIDRQERAAHRPGPWRRLW